MKKAVLVFALLMVFAASISVVSATPATAVSGQIFITGGSSVSRDAGNSGNVFREVDGVGFYTGDISGAFTGDAFWSFQKFATPDMHVTGHIRNYVTATFMQKTGTLVIDLTVSSNLDENNWVIVGGTGELKGLHGQGKYQAVAPGGVVLAYEGNVHFDP